MNEKKLNRMRLRVGPEPLIPGLDGKPKRSESRRSYPDAVHHPGVDDPDIANAVVTSPALELARIISSGNNQEYDLKAAKALAIRWRINGTPSDASNK